MKKIKIKKIAFPFFPRLLFALAGFIFITLTPVQAATLFVDPENNDRRPGDIFPVTLMIESTDRAVNSISATFDFPSNLMEVVSVSKKGSIIDLWTSGPSFSNRTGTVEFEGVVLDPGFKGVAGEILTVNFKANKEGAAVLKYLSPKVLINNGQDESVLEEALSSEFLIKDVVASASSTDIANEEKIISIEKEETAAEEISDEPEESLPAGDVPAAVEVRSTTHADPERWFAFSKADFYWSMPDDAEEVKILVNNYASSSPRVHYEYRLASKTLEDVDDGEWYFHLQLKNASGWGAVSHFPFKVDASAPVDLSISSSSGAGEFFLSARDEFSGLDHYEISVDDKEPAVLAADGDKQKFKLYSLAAGEHILHVRAFDKASNTAEAELAFSLAEDLSGKALSAVAGEIKTEKDLSDSSIVDSLKGWRLERFNLGWPALSAIVFSALALVFLIYSLILKKKLEHCRQLAFTKLQTAEKVLNNVYSIAFDQASYLEEAKKKKKRLTAAETKVLSELKRALDEVEAEYK